MFDWVSDEIFNIDLFFSSVIAFKALFCSDEISTPKFEDEFSIASSNLELYKLEEASN